MGLRAIATEYITPPVEPDGIALTPYRRHVITPRAMPLRKAGPARIEVIAVTGLPEVVPGANLGELTVTHAERQGTPLRAGDIVVVTQKVVSKAEGRLVDLTTVAPSEEATSLAAELDRDPRLVHVILSESREIVRKDSDRGILITETFHGIVCANAGVDASNVAGEDMVSLLPVDSDASAARIASEVREATGLAAPVIITDTLGRAWREGQVNFAIGVAGMAPLHDYRGSRDAVGQELKVTAIAVVDEIAAAAELVMGKATSVPVAIARGYAYDAGPGSSGSLIRARSKDLFR